jgi:polyhydroxybutyrate depolymerase
VAVPVVALGLCLTGCGAAGRARAATVSDAGLLVSQAAQPVTRVAAQAQPVAAAGLAPSTTLRIPVGTSTQHLVVGGVQRSFIVTRPAGLPAHAPLVLMLHGGYGSAKQAEQAYGWDAAARAHGFVVAYPDGLNHAWNAGGGCCGQPGASGVDDVGFLTATVRAISAAVPIDARRLYATGMSNGGLMAYRLACDTDVFAAIGPDSATLLGSCPGPAPISVIAIHGTADENIPYQGGEGSGSAHVDGPSVPSVNAFWRGVDDCRTPTTTTLHRSQTVVESVAACPSRRTVELITVVGAGHQWPGPDTRTPAQIRHGADKPSTALDATSTIWSFFAAHPRP